MDRAQDWLVPHAPNEWVKRQEIDSGVREGITTSEAQRVNDLEREVKELRRAKRDLETGQCV